MLPKGYKHSIETRLKIGKAMIGRKHSEETKRKIGDSHRGRKRKPFSKEWRLKLSIAGKGRPCWNKGLHGIHTGPKKGFNPWNTGKKWSPEIRNKISKSRIGKGMNPDKLAVNNSRLIKWSKAIIKRDGKCKGCQSIEKLEAHHILPKALYPEKIYELSNGIALCHRCHKKTDSYGKRLDLKMKPQSDLYGDIEKEAEMTSSPIRE